MLVAIDIKRWTLDELHSLPDDGNKYEVVRGVLFVTPAPTWQHESILAALSAALSPYVVANGLGLVYHPRAVLRFEDSEVEPDLMVRRPSREANVDWTTAPLPSLIVEVLSPSTRSRDRKEKRTIYGDARIQEYWIVDPEQKDRYRHRAERVGSHCPRHAGVVSGGGGGGTRDQAVRHLHRVTSVPAEVEFHRPFDIGGERPASR